MLKRSLLELIPGGFLLKDKYPLLSKMSLALLTIFHGPRVESSFSVMGDVMDKSLAE